MFCRTIEIHASRIREVRGSITRTLTNCAAIALATFVFLPAHGYAAPGNATRAPALILPLSPESNDSHHGEEYHSANSALDGGADSKRDQHVRLNVRLDKRVYAIGDTLSFTLTTNKTCELNILYKQANDDIIVFPQYFEGSRLLGDPILRKGERRQIPVSSDLVLEITPPSGSEELTIQCRVGGLVNNRVVAKDIRNWNVENGDAFRGLSASIVESSRRDPSIHYAETFRFRVNDRTQQSAGVQ